MPKDGAKLSPRAIAAIVQWLDLGAPYDRPLTAPVKDPLAWTRTTILPEARSYWAFQPLKKVLPPQIANGWGNTPIDSFVNRRLREKNLSPAGRASDRQILRRIYLDLLGIPPTVEETAAFLASNHPDKVDRLARRLLNRTEYGERWARYWLDVSRFAESHGFEHDYDREFAFHYRDFVIKALNQDMPYDQFVRWQLAGDEIAPENPLALMATGFLGAGVFPTQITKNEVERTRYDALDDMAATTGTAMLGITVGCARCHDHKFDPIPQSDYYRFISTFTTTVRSEVALDLNPAEYRRAKAAFDVEHRPLLDARAKYEAAELPGKFRAWEAGGGLKTAEPKWTMLEIATSSSAGGATLTRQADGSLLATGKNPAFDTYTLVAATSVTRLTAIRLEALADKTMVKKGPGRARNGNFALTDFRVSRAGQHGKSQPLALHRPQATFEQKNLWVRHAIDANKKSGWAVDPQFGKNHAAVFEFRQPIELKPGDRLTVTLEFKGNTGHNIGRPRLSISSYPPPFDLSDKAAPAAVVRALKTPHDKRTAAQLDQLHRWYRERDSGWQTLNAAVQSHLAGAPKPHREKVMICSEGVKPMRRHSQGADFFDKTYYLRRGDTDQKQTAAPAGFLQVLTRAKASTWNITPPNGSRLSFRRRRLAAWMTDSKAGGRPFAGASHCQPRVAVSPRPRHRFHAQRLRKPGQPADPSRVTRLAGAEAD